MSFKCMGIRVEGGWRQKGWAGDEIRLRLRVLIFQKKVLG